MTLRTTLAVALTAAGLASSANAQVYIDPVHGTATIGGTSYNPVVGSSSSYYYTPGTTAMTYGSTGYVTPGGYTYTTPTTGWSQTGYTYPNTGYTSYTYPSTGYTAYTYPGYGTTYGNSGYIYNGSTYPTYTGTGYYNPSYSSGYYNNGYVNTVRRWFRRY